MLNKRSVVDTDTRQYIHQKTVTQSVRERGKAYLPERLLNTDLGENRHVPGMSHRCQLTAWLRSARTWRHSITDDEVVTKINPTGSKTNKSSVSQLKYVFDQ